MALGAYYNEIDPYAAKWLRHLIAARLLAPGDVDERSILDVQPKEIAGYAQVHLFAGIGGWSYALRLARWPDFRRVWTGSCPCQPFSAAGKRRGAADVRHLWPEMRRLVAECAPPVLFGEQVASKDGRLWLAGVRADLEGMGYAVGAADLCAASVGAPHIRQRLWWVADTGSVRSAAGLPESTTGETGDAEIPLHDRGRDDTWGDARRVPGFDGKSRRLGPGITPLAHGIPARVGKLRAYGNAIVPQLAAQFIGAYLDGLA